MGRFANFRFRWRTGKWGYVLINGGNKELMNSMRVLRRMGFTAETGQYYLPTQHGEGGLFDYD